MNDCLCLAWIFLTCWEFHALRQAADLVSMHACWSLYTIYVCIHWRWILYSIEIDWTTEGHVLMYGIAFSPLLFPCGCSIPYAYFHHMGICVWYNHMHMVWIIVPWQRLLYIPHITLYISRLYCYWLTLVFLKLSKGEHLHSINMYIVHVTFGLQGGIDLRWWNWWVWVK